MNIYTTQLKRSIREKLEYVNDAEYLATLDAILTYETISPAGKLPREDGTRKFSWKRFWPFTR
jgi:hypothetical protein